MRYYSDSLKKFFETEDECFEAEEKYEAEVKALKEKKEAEAAERKAAAAIVEEKLEAASKAKKEYNDALHDFCEKYGSFHTSVDSKSMQNKAYSVWDLFDFMF